MARTIAQVDADIRARTRLMLSPHLKHAEVRAEIDALLEERHRLRGPLRPSQVMARNR